VCGAVQAGLEAARERGLWSAIEGDASIIPGWAQSEGGKGIHHTGKVFPVGCDANFDHQPCGVLLPGLCHGANLEALEAVPGTISQEVGRNATILCRA